jgi:hypothetical protein
MFPVVLVSVGQGLLSLTIHFMTASTPLGCCYFVFFLRFLSICRWLVLLGFLSKVSRRFLMYRNSFGYISHLLLLPGLFLHIFL